MGGISQVIVPHVGVGDILYPFGLRVLLRLGKAPSPSASISRCPPAGWPLPPGPDFPVRVRNAATNSSV